ncbi:META domain-containing protein [Celeribacter indicus]|uniref:DUF306 domain-containing protein n=1 Tax=Celeribacter indicus TaxID=1208324 RepID=A0A0B5DV50_9RHOB|nr:META domain-containing protein [Celeribacter indicus]AJE45085.1 hypothetical protein P73_0370 [Celeribacter indicus]SDX42889.1 Heat shock protein HslJ [Celeribacter indicus]
MFPRGLSVLLAFALGAPAAATPFGFETRVTCEAEAGVVGFAGDTALLYLRGSRFDLMRLPSASGEKYATETGDTVFWLQGEEALLQVAGTGNQSCALTLPDTPWRAQGNEPGWILTVEEGRLSAQLDYGETEFEADLTAPVREGESLVHTLPDHDLTLSLSREICYDGMSGQAYPEKVTLRLGERELSGCGGRTLDLLAGANWQVETIDGAVPVEGRMPELSISDDLRVAGTSGCNRFSGGLEITGEGIAFGPMAATRMMCPADLMAQETALLDALSSTSRFEIAEDGALVLHGPEGPVLTARR